MVSDTYYNAMGSRSFYKGTSFRCTEWCVDTHYFNNEDFIDFVSYKGALLRCTRSHISSVDNEPSLVINNNLIVGINDSPVWEFVMGGGSIETGQLNIDFKLEDDHLWVFYNEEWKDLGNVKGDQGEPGVQGIPGNPGKGVPSGGSTNQVLVKQSNSDYDTIWKTINTSGGELPSFSARVLSTTSTEDTPEAAVTLSDSNEFQFSFKLQRGQDGVNGKDGKPGKDGANGTPGINGDGLKYIYIRTTKATKPTTPTGSGEDVELPTDTEWGLWKSAPTGVDSTHRWEWVSTSVYVNGRWESYSEPSLFAYYALDGVNGTAPNYKTYVYAQSNSKPEKPDFNTPQPPTESQWKDYPLSSGQWWQCIGVVDGQTNTVIQWGEVLPVNGKDGTAQDGKFTEFRFAVNSSNITPPSLSNTVRTPEGWSLTPPTKSNSQYLWMTTAVINPNDTLFRNWSTPICISGENGEAGPTGATGAAGNWTSYVFKNSSSTPDTPTGTDPVPTGWSDAPTSSDGTWWMSKALISGVTQKVVGEWSAPQRITGEKGQDGEDGTNGTDGIYTDYKFAKSSSKSEVPSINKQSSNPGSNWSDQWPIINSGEFLWMTFIKKNSKDDSIVLGEEWATPVCITGEQGPQGPIGSTGVSGIPGVGIVMRFCNGTDTEPSNAKPTNTLDTASQGWTITPPSTTEDYPRLWFIQGRIKYLNNEDQDGQLDGSWSDPALFNGPAGVNGEAGKKGQLIYPAGVYDINTTYSTTEESAPYVYVYNSESSKSGYYLLSAVTSWTGTDHNNWSPVESIDNEEHYWTKFNHFEAIFADVSIFPNSLVGSAVFNGDYMFSQTGKESTGITTNYNKFDPEDLSKWYPAYYINLRTGECSLNFGQCTFKYSDLFNSRTVMTIEGGINIIPDMISPSRYGSYISTPCISILADEEGLANGNIYKFALSEEYLPVAKGVIKGSIDNCTYLNGLEENDEDYVAISPAESTSSSKGIINFVTYQNGTIRTTISEIYLGAGRTLSYSFVPIKYLGDSLYSTYTSIFDVADTEDGTAAYRGISGILNISNVNDFVLIVCHQAEQGIQYGGLTFTKAGSFLVSKVLDVNPVK